MHFGVFQIWADTALPVNTLSATFWTKNDFYGNKTKATLYSALICNLIFCMSLSFSQL